MSLDYASFTHVKKSTAGTTAGSMKLEVGHSNALIRVFGAIDYVLVWMD